MPITGLGANRASQELLEVATRHPEAAVAVSDASDPNAASMRQHLGGRLAFGPDEVAALAATPGCIVVNGIVGAAGLPSSVAAAEAGNRLALANKESLVAGGPVVLEAIRKGGGELIPIDSEHSALWQCLVGEDRDSVRRLVLTASGGPFRGMTTADLAAVTVDQALAHPTWDMGPRITIDSATLMNKAFEVIEAHFLFGLGYDQIAVVVHPQSIVHSMVDFVDGTVKAEMGNPDMRVPIQYAITYPDRIDVPGDVHELVGMDLTFEQPDRSTFRCLDLGYAAGRQGGSSPAVLNAADEVAVAAFLDHRIPFLAIADVVEATLGAVSHRAVDTVDDVLGVDTEAREAADREVAQWASR